MNTRAELHKKELAEAEVLYQETRAALVKSQEQATLLSQRAEGDAAEILTEQGKRKRVEAEAEVLRAKVCCMHVCVLRCALSLPRPRPLLCRYVRVFVACVLCGV